MVEWMGEIFTKWEYVELLKVEIDKLEKENERLKQESKDWENKYYDCRKMLGTENDKLKHDIKILQILKNIKEQESIVGGLI